MISNKFIYIFLPIISFIIVSIFSIKISIFDKRYKIIKNDTIKSLSYALLVILALNLFITISSLITKTQYYLNFIFYKIYLIHTLLTIIISIIIWINNLWPAGDAKYFLILSLFLPFINHNTNNYFLSVSLLINSFVLAAFYLISKNIFFVILKQKDKKYLTNILKISIINLKIFNLKNFLLINIIFYFLNYIISIDRQINIFLSLILYISWDNLTKFIQQKKSFKLIIIGILIVILSIALNPIKFWIVLKTSFENYLKSILLIFFIKLTENFFDNTTKKYLDINDIRPGMTLSSDYIKIISNHPFFTNQNILEKKLKFKIDQEMIDKIKQWKVLYPSKINEKIEVSESVSFAIWILLGFLTQFYFEKNIIFIIQTKVYPFITTLIKTLHFLIIFLIKYIIFIIQYLIL